jgi:hypothetical protein
MMLVYRVRRSPVAAALIAAGLLLPALAFSQKPPGSVSAAPSASAPSASAATSTAAGVSSGASLSLPPQQKARQIWDLIAGGLEPSVEPGSLFDVTLGDDAAIRVAAARSRALLREMDAQGGEAAPGKTASVPGTASTAVASTSERLGLAPEQLAAHLELERARLAFYGRPAEEREILLVAHRERQQKAAAQASKESEQERRIREAEEARQRALAAAAHARSEAERLVSEELARLLGLENELASRRQDFAEQERAIQQRRDALLGWQRRAREAREQGAVGADPMYEELRGALRRTQGQIREVLDELSSGKSRVPGVGGNPLRNLRVEVDTAKAREQRLRVEALATSLREQEQRLREDQAAALLEELNTLNQERLGLLPVLSPGLRSAVTGFSEQGWEQARAEASHLALIARYHQHAAAGWLVRLQSQERSLGEATGSALLVLVPWMMLLLAYSWWRRSGSKILEEIEARILEDNRARKTQGGVGVQGVRLLRAAQTPLELLLLFWAMMGLLPKETKDLLEVQLLSVSVGWILASALVVNVTNALFSALGTQVRGEQAGDLRLRSLRLVRRVVVAFALVLVLSSRLVGEGTIYRWVLLAFWAAVFPLFLVLLRWWREELFARIEHERKKGAVYRWILANQRGWASFPAALLAVSYVLVTIALRLARLWLNGFHLARRAHAYLFRRELDKLERERSIARLAPLAGEALASLGPEARSERWIEGSWDASLERISRRLQERRGGVVALVGARGMGKTEALRRLLEASPEALLVPCEGLDLAGMQATLAVRLGLPSDAHLQVVGAALDREEEPRHLLLDDAQAFIRTVMGGLRGLDQLVGTARGYSKRAVWVLAVDEIVWTFLSRARSICPLFDEVIFLDPWREEQIAALLTERSAQAGLSPSFEGLLEQLPPGADEQDRQDALQERKDGYFRLVWDHAGGNPGVALQVWRSSLAQDEAGTPVVRVLQVPDVTELERLPDAVLFVLRAILQLAPAYPAQIDEATRLDGDALHDALRYGLARGYLAEDGGRFRVTWAWYQPIMQLLQRHQLLVKR